MALTSKAGSRQVFVGGLKDPIFDFIYVIAGETIIIDNFLEFILFFGYDLKVLIEQQYLFIGLTNVEN